MNHGRAQRRGGRVCAPDARRFAGAAGDRGAGQPADDAPAAAAAQAYAGGQAYRDRDFAFAANKALEELVEAAKEEAADRLQDTLNKLSLLIGFVPIVARSRASRLDLVNASIARGHYEEAAFAEGLRLPIVGDAAQACGSCSCGASRRRDDASGGQGVKTGARRS
ncbi:MAG: hypothetical protein ACE37H_17095 [Phycisphaeraceae bacterium]